MCTNSGTGFILTLRGSLICVFIQQILPAFFCIRGPVKGTVGDKDSGLAHHHLLGLLVTWSKGVLFALCLAPLSSCRPSSSSGLNLFRAFFFSKPPIFTPYQGGLLHPSPHTQEGDAHDLSFCLFLVSGGTGWSLRGY